MNNEKHTTEMLNPEAIHTWFGLSYANYLVIPRVALQSMPAEWQRRFVNLVEQIPNELPDYEDLLPSGYFHVSCRDDKGRFVHDNFPHYQRGRAMLRTNNVVRKDPETSYSFKEMIDFVKWYSGMEQQKIVNAWNRYLVERNSEK